ncbi:MAG: phosphatidylserine decarboxylase, partial [Alcaligenaceae bacterium]|nr:phosphatidylserine decarboxylase [Alcaligenaceae bacterium]
QTWQYNGDYYLEKGDEMGQFLLGSTVVLVYPDVGYEFEPDWQPGRPITMGEAMARRV